MTLLKYLLLSNQSKPMSLSLRTTPSFTGYLPPHGRHGVRSAGQTPGRLLAYRPAPVPLSHCRHEGGKHLFGDYRSTDCKSMAKPLNTTPPTTPMRMLSIHEYEQACVDRLPREEKREEHYKLLYEIAQSEDTYSSHYQCEEKTEEESEREKETAISAHTAAAALTGLLPAARPQLPAGRWEIYDSQCHTEQEGGGRCPQTHTAVTSICPSLSPDHDFIEIGKCNMLVLSASEEDQQGMKGGDVTGIGCPYIREVKRYQE
ncbi:unnamed protein product [Pleuronectes platessa]|uniref:Uncharacterized protein n=1 Tax=Pleuronectes platessa TaxID=8262 RepID=A0A9N7URJ9_PLEPL|nr:unnamed protein product [Pleuronectes platessa]